jgi:leucyl/phenylalanyl-tRNA--protein transferase
MPVRRETLAWWSPDPRGIIPIDRLRVSRSLRRSIRRFETRIDSDFDQVISTCANLPRPHGWITGEIVEAYRRLHEIGVAHSVECWDGDRLIGGLYGINIGSLFAGESMFHLEPDASKVALVRLVDELRGIDQALLDVQWNTSHLESLGAIDVARRQYVQLLDEASAGPRPAGFTATTSSNRLPGGTHRPSGRTSGRSSR